MSLRKGLFGVALTLVVAGAASAEPPLNPLVEGREPDPIAREFYEPEKATFGYVSGVGSESQVPQAAGWWAYRAAWESLFNRLTMPLGTVQIWD